MNATSDTISRADALAVIEGERVSGETDDATDLAYNVALDHALAAINALPAVGWQPIETADGSLCQVTDGGYVVTAFKQGADWICGWQSGDMETRIKLQPTHWMPLPDAP